MVMYNGYFLPTSGFKWIDRVWLNRCTSNSYKGWTLKTDLEYPKELHELHNYYPLDSDEIEKRNAVWL